MFLCGPSSISFSRLPLFVHCSDSVEKPCSLRGALHGESSIILWDLKAKQCEKEN